MSYPTDPKYFYKNNGEFYLRTVDCPSGKHIKANHAEVQYHRISEIGKDEKLIGLQDRITQYENKLDQLKSTRDKFYSHTTYEEQIRIRKDKIWNPSVNVNRNHQWCQQNAIPRGPGMFRTNHGPHPDELSPTKRPGRPIPKGSSRPVAPPTPDELAVLTLKEYGIYAENYTKTKTKYHTWLLKHHPDKGGDNDLYVKVNLAWIKYRDSETSSQKP